jgi:hypothetical protein
LEKEYSRLERRCRMPSSAKRNYKVSFAGEFFPNIKTRRLKVFDVDGIKPMVYSELLKQDMASKLA